MQRLWLSETEPGSNYHLALARLTHDLSCFFVSPAPALAPKKWQLKKNTFMNFPQQLINPKMKKDFASEKLWEKNEQECEWLVSFNFLTGTPRSIAVECTDHFRSHWNYIRTWKRIDWDYHGKGSKGSNFMETRCTIRMHVTTQLFYAFDSFVRNLFPIPSDSNS